MAKGKKRTYKYETRKGTTAYATFRNLSATYKRYREEYYKKAMKIYKKLHPRAKGEKARYINRATLRSVMADKNGPLPRENFIAAYQEQKEILLKNDSTADPIQYMVSESAYKYSEAEYRSFIKFTRENEGFQRVSREAFRTGDFATREEWKEFLSKEYQNKKEELAKMGLERDEILELARKYIQSNYFRGSP